MRLVALIFVFLLLTPVAFSQQQAVSVQDDISSALVIDRQQPLNPGGSVFTSQRSTLTPSYLPGPGQLPGFSNDVRLAEKDWVCVNTEEPCPYEKFGISPGLSTGPETRPKPLISYENEQPFFNAASLHRDEVIEDVIKWVRKQEWDSSGLIGEIYIAPARAGIGGW